jgi:hypothetical protein
MRIRGRCLAQRSKDALGLIQAAADEQQFGYALTVARPLLNLVEVAVVRDELAAVSRNDVHPAHVGLKCPYENRARGFS